MLKKLLLASLSLVTLTAFADIPDYYTGVQLGYGSTSNDSANTTVNGYAVTLTPDKHTGFAGRLLVGYAVTPFYAMELGLEKYNNASWHAAVDNEALPDTTLSLYGADIAMRFSWIQKSSVSLYNTLGLACVGSRYDSDYEHDQLEKVHYFLRPELGVGGNYNLSQTTQLNLSYQHVFGKGNLNSATNAQDASDYLPTVTILTLGVIYNF